MEYELHTDRYWNLCVIGDLVKIKSEYKKHKDIFENNKYDLMYIACEYRHLDIVKWIMSLDNNMSSMYLYIVALNETCESKNREILDYLYSLHIFNDLGINTRTFSRLFYNAMYDFDVDFMNYMYTLFPFEIINQNSNEPHQAFKWASRCDAITRARWIISKKPYHYELTVNEHDKQVMFYRIVPEKERRWNQLKTVLWMSQVKPEAPHKPSIFRRIPDDVVQVEICSYL